MRLGPALAAEQIGEAGERGIGHEFVRAVVVQVHPLEVEKDEVAPDRGAALLGSAEEAPNCGIVAVGRVLQVRKDHRRVHELVDVLQLGDRGVELGGRQLCEHAAILRRESLGVHLCRGEVFRDLRIVQAGVEGREVPYRAVGGTGRRGHSHRKALAGPQPGPRPGYAWVSTVVP